MRSAISKMAGGVSGMLHFSPEGRDFFSGWIQLNRAGMVRAAVTRSSTVMRESRSISARNAASALALRRGRLTVLSFLGIREVSQIHMKGASATARRMAMGAGSRFPWATPAPGGSEVAPPWMGVLGRREGMAGPSSEGAALSHGV